MTPHLEEGNVHDTRPLIDARARLARWSVVFAAVALVAAACSGSAASSAPASVRASVAPATAAPASTAPSASTAASAAPSAAAVPVNPYFETGAVAGSGKGKKIGYISLGEQVSFAVLVSNSIKEQATKAGA